MCFSLRWRLFCVLGGIISRAEYSKSPSVSRETIPPRRLAEEGVKNWPGRRNRLPHPVCKPLDSKEGGADGWVSSAGPPASQFLTASQRGDGLASKPVPSLTLGAMWKSSRHAVKAMDSSTFACHSILRLGSP